jgi:hypothetical protein
MILGFAHITRNVPKGDDEPDIPSAPEKWPLMGYKARHHSIAMERCPDTGITKEVVQYDTGLVDEPSRLEIDHCIRIKAREPSAEALFLVKGLGFRYYQDGSFFMDSACPQWSLGKLVIDKDTRAPTDPYLDIAGLSALAFYSSDVQESRDRLLKYCGRAPTDPFTVTIGNRDMKIIMLRSLEGTIVELIEVRP